MPGRLRTPELPLDALAVTHPTHDVGLINLGVEGPASFPATDFGFAVQWRAAPMAVRREMRRTPVSGLIVQIDVPGLDATAAVFRSAAQLDKDAEVWLAMVSPHEYVIAKVVEIRRRVKRPSGVDSVLTPREHDVLASIRQGRTNHGIALDLGISLSTVKRHVEHILLKLQAKNRTEAAARDRR
jgi:DNA-binding NarL/FixJ family response regulator